jgi:hypothetical protein
MTITTLAPVHGTPFAGGSAYRPGFQYVDGSGIQRLAKSNFTAQSPPTAGDDETSGYGVGSKWYTGTAVYECLDASQGAANWTQTNAAAIPGGVSGSIQYNDGANGLAGSANATLDVSGNLTLAGNLDLSANYPYISVAGNQILRGQTSTGIRVLDNKAWLYGNDVDFGMGYHSASDTLRIFDGLDITANTLLAFSSSAATFSVPVTISTSNDNWYFRTTGGLNAREFSYHYSSETYPRYTLSTNVLGGLGAGISFAYGNGNYRTSGCAVGASAANTLGLYTSNGVGIVERVSISASAATFSVPTTINAASGDPLTVQVAGATKLIVNENGVTGVGVDPGSSNTGRLWVQGSVWITTNERLRFGSSHALAGGIGGYHNADTVIYGYQSDGGDYGIDFRSGSGSTSRLRIANDGAVGTPNEITVGQGTTNKGIAFGDGDTRIYEVLDDWLYIAVAGTGLVWGYFPTNGGWAGWSGGTGKPILCNASTTSYCGHSWQGDMDSGLHRSGADTIQLVTGAAPALTIDSSQNATFAGQILAPSGTVGVPSYSFDGDTDIGFYRPGANQIAYAVGGAVKLRIDSSGRFNFAYYGTSSEPCFTWISDPNTGFGHGTGADEFQVLTGGVVATLWDSSQNATFAANLSFSGQMLAPSSGSVSAPEYGFADTAGMGMYYYNNTNLGFAVGSINRLQIGTSALYINPGAKDYDFIVYGDTDTSLIRVDASTDCIGIGQLANSGYKFTINANGQTYALRTVGGHTLLTGGHTKVGSAAYALSAGDLGVSRESSPTQGVIYLGSAGDCYIHKSASYLSMIFGGATVWSLASTAYLYAPTRIRKDADNQFYIERDVSNYCSFSVSTSGNLTVTPNGGDINLAAHVGINCTPRGAAGDLTVARNTTDGYLYFGSSSGCYIAGSQANCTYGFTTSLTTSDVFFNLTHTTSGTPAAGFGAWLRYNLETTVTTRSAGAVACEWIDATDATRKGRVSLYAYDTAAREGLRVDATGSAATVTIYGETTVTGTVQCSSTSGPAMLNEGSYGDNPTLIPNRGYTNSGLSGGSWGCSLVAGGTQILQVVNFGTQPNVQILSTTTSSSDPYNHTLKLAQTLNDSTDPGTTTFNGILYELTDTNIGGWSGGVNLLNMKVGGSSKFTVSNAGNVYIPAGAGFIHGNNLRLSGAAVSKYYTNYSVTSLAIERASAFTIFIQDRDADTATQTLTMRGHNAFSTATTNQDGGPVHIYGGAGSSAAGKTGTGGHVYLYGGAPSPAGTDGDLYLCYTGSTTRGNANLGDGANVVLGTSTGTQIGTAASQKLSLWGATPVAQPSHIADADGTLSDITTKFNSLLAKLETMGALAAA